MSKQKTKVVNFSSQESAKGFAERVDGEVRIAKDNHPYVVFKTDGTHKNDPGRNPNIAQPSIRPEGTEGPEWDDYCWSEDDY